MNKRVCCTIRNQHFGTLIITSLALMSLSTWSQSTWLGASLGWAQESRQVTAADLPRIPHTPLQKALQTFTLANGFRLELVAGEPLVSDPVDACFDEHGWMYVAEMHGYPFSQEPTKLNPSGGGKKDAGIIRLLKDTDGDGQFDKSVIFADQISWPTSVCCYNGGLFVLAPRFLYYFKDTDGDGTADVREVVLEGFGRDNVQSVTNGLKWGLDNKIYFAAGRNGGKLLHRGKPLFTISGSDIRFDPRTETFELVSGGLQFGHSMNDWGQRFVCSNSNHIQQVVYPKHYFARHPGLAAPTAVRSIAADGASAQVFRASPPEPWRIIRQKWRAEAKGYRLVIEDGAWKFLPLDPSKKSGVVPTEYPVGFFTSATGVTIYRGAAYPQRYRGNAFVGDVGGNLVHRKTVRLNGITYQAARADAGEELLRSTDNWFRPVNFVNAPDGTLFILDMYRETVEHPYSIPEEIKKFLFLESGDDRGRIYRLLSPDARPLSVDDLGQASASQLVSHLNSPNAWHRETAQRLLWERRDGSVLPALHQLVSEGDDLGRLHAAYTLHGLEALEPRDIEPLVTHSNPRLREHGIRLAEPFLKNAEVLDLVLGAIDDVDSRVRFQLAFSLGESSLSEATAGLAQLARESGASDEIRLAILSSSADRADALTALLLKDSAFLQSRHAGTFLSELAVSIGSLKSPEPALRLLASTAELNIAPQLQQDVITSLGEGLQRRGTTLAKLLSSTDAAPALIARVQKLFQRAVTTALDAEQSLMNRTAAVGLLAFAPPELAVQSMEQLLSPQTPALLQRAAISALAQLDAEGVAPLLIEHWKSFSPSLRREATDALLANLPRIELLLKAVEDGRVQPSELDRDKIQVLVNHPNATIKTASQQLLAGNVDSDRAKVVVNYQKVLQLDADASRGRKVFERKCSLCHQVGSLGHQVAPDLASVQNKSAADLLIAILDPNREAQPNFNTYTVVTTDGRILTGIIASEGANSITLRKAEGKEDVVLRENIDELVASGKSLMPEGLEKELQPQDLADVIAFIKTIKPKSGKTPTP